MSKLIDEMKKNKKLSDLIIKDVVKDEWLSTNVMSVNLLFSGKIRGGIKKGKISVCAADSQQGKSLIGLNVLRSAYKAGLDCFVIDTEHAFNYSLAQELGINLDDIVVYDTAKIPEIKQIFGQINHGLTREESRNVFVLLDSWGPIVTAQVMDKAEEASSAVDMSMPKFKNELANVINACGNTVFVVNHVYASLQMYGEKFEIPGGKRLFFNADAIMLASSAAKYKDAEGSVLGKVITAGVKKGRSAKEFVKTHFLIRHDGGLDPFYGLLDEACDSGVVVKPKNGCYTRPDYDKDGKTWKENELYCSAFWVPLYKDPAFNEFLEKKFAFEDSKLISATEDVFDMIDGKTELSTESLPTAEPDSEDDDEDK